MPKLQSKAQSSAREAARRSWAMTRGKGKFVFYLGIALAFVAIACDLVLLGALFFWNRLAAMSSFTLIEIAAIAALCVLLVAPLIGLAIAKPLWNWVDRQLS